MFNFLSSKPTAKVAQDKVEAPAKTAIEKALLAKEKQAERKAEAAVTRRSSIDRGQAILKRIAKTIDEMDQNGLLPEQLDAREEALRREAERLSRYMDNLGL